MESNLTLIFLQGLGNSIINFPIYYQLSKRYSVNVVTYNNGSSKFYSSFGATVFTIHSAKELLKVPPKLHTDVAISLFPNWRREMIALNLIHAKKKFHFSSKPWMTPFFQGKKLHTDKNRHDVENNAELFSALGLSYDWKLDLATEMGIKKEMTDKYVVIHPTASTKFKFYPREFWITLIRHLEERYSRIMIISGTAEMEVEFCQSLMSSRTEYHAGLTFPELSSLIANSDLFIGLDSSMMHLAAMFKRQVVALWSFADFRRIYPYTNASLYVPKEVLSITNFSYPAKELVWLGRARAEDVIKIMMKKALADFYWKNQSGNTINLFSY